MDKKFKIIGVTNRLLAGDSFISRFELISDSNVDMIVLREKDLPENKYMDLASELIKICKAKNKPLILHSFVNAAISLNHPYIHLPFDIFLSLDEEKKAYFKTIGVSTHTLKEAVTACELKASYITAGHIFKTDCKPNINPKGRAYLKEVCEAVSIPVFAIGGINKTNIPLCISSGASGVCMMSEFMNGDNFETES